MINAEVETPLAGQMGDIMTCVHCGFCLPVCPTYQLLGNENDSPRGRLYLMLAVAEGRLSASDPIFARHIDRCLGCRACEPVCPSGVRYGYLLEQARRVRVDAGGVADRLARWVLNVFFTRPKLQNFFWFCARALRTTRLPLLIARLGSPATQPGRLRFALAMLAATAPRRRRLDGAALIEGPEAKGRGPESQRGAPRVAVLEGCVMSGLLPHINRATERALRAYGADVVRLPAGACCGALHAHAGELAVAEKLALRLIDLFDESGAEVLVTNSAGCGAALKEYVDWFAGDEAVSERASHFSAAVSDISEWLIERPAPDLRPIAARVEYDAACHLLHAQKTDAVEALLSSIPELVVTQLPRSERCCGGAGIYGISQRRLSHELLKEKLEEIQEAEARFVVTANPGCLMQIGAGAMTNRQSFAVVHAIEVLDEALVRL